MMRSKRNLDTELLVIGIFFTLIGVLFALTLSVTQYRMGLVRADGVETQAVIERIYHTGGHPPTYYIAYHFSDEQGATHHSEDAYPFADRDTLHPGDAISVSYRRDNPDHNYITRRLQRRIGFGKEFIIDNIPWIGAFYCLWMYDKRRRRLKGKK